VFNQSEAGEFDINAVLAKHTNEISGFAASSANDGSAAGKPI